MNSSDKEHLGTEHDFKLGFITVGDPNSPRSWSGTPYFMAQALQESFPGLTRLGPLSSHWSIPARLYSRLLFASRGRRISPPHAVPVASGVAAGARRAICDAGVQAVVAPAGSVLAKGVPDDVAFIYTSDATAHLIDGYYPRYSNLSPRARRRIEYLEQEAIDRANLLLYPTRWAAESAMQDYGADESKVHVTPWGANFSLPPDAQGHPKSTEDGTCRLLFVGVSWERKGAQIAVDALTELRLRGYKVELTICGCTPPQELEVEGLRIIPFLDKKDPAQFEELNSLYREADLFFLPTRSECYGIAFCEASAYGLPSIATKTGGIPGVVEEGENGHLLPPSAGGREYADLLQGILENKERLHALRASSRRAFEQRLNWSSWGRDVASLIRSTANRT